MKISLVAESVTNLLTFIRQEYIPIQSLIFEGADIFDPLLVAEYRPKKLCIPLAYILRYIHYVICSPYASLRR